MQSLNFWAWGLPSRLLLALILAALIWALIFMAWS